MRGLIVALICLCAAGLVACRGEEPLHPAVGDWKSEMHGLHVHPDRTAMYRGAAAIWEPIDSHSIRLGFQTESGDRAYEFVVSGEGAPRVLAASDTTGLVNVQTDHFDGFTIVNSDSEIGRQIQIAKAEGREIGTLRTPVGGIAFIRTQ